jgi:hypothetical protein
LILRRSGDAQNSPGELRYSLSVTLFNLVFRSLEEIQKRSQVIRKKKGMAGLIDKSNDSQEVVSLVEELRRAIVYYQVREDHAVSPRVNTRGTALAATVDV